METNAVDEQNALVYFEVSDCPSCPRNFSKLALKSLWKRGQIA